MLLSETTQAPTETSDNPTSTTLPPETPSPSSTETPVANTQDDPFAEQRETQRLLMQSLREQAAETNRLRGMLEQRQQQEQQTAAQQQAAREAEQVPEFMRPQMEAMERMIDRKLKESVEPLHVTARQMAVQNARNEIRGQLAAHPQLGPIYAQLKAEIDNAIDTMPNPDPNVVSATVYAIYGNAMANGRINLATPNNTTPVTPPTNPSIRNVPSTQQNSREAPKAPLNITESERAMARRAKMTDEAWIRYRDSDGSLEDLISIGDMK